MTDEFTGVPLVAAIVLLGMPSDIYGLFYCVTLLAKQFGAKPSAMPIPIAMCWFITNLVGPYPCIVVLILTCLLIWRKRVAIPIKIAGSAFGVLCVFGTSMVVYEVYKFGR